MGIKVRVGLRAQVVPPGAHRARVTQIKEGEFFKRRTIEFVFELVDGEHKGVQVRGFLNGDYDAFSAHTKLYKWFTAATKDELEPGAELDLDAFYNKVFEVQIETKTSRKTKNQFSNVTEILRTVWDL
jgi:hypothetical protein